MSDRNTTATRTDDRRDDYSRDSRRDYDRRDDRDYRDTRTDDRRSTDYRSSDRRDDYRSSDRRYDDRRADDRYDDRRRDDRGYDDRRRDNRGYDDRRRNDRFDFRSRDAGWRDRGYMRLDDPPRSPPPPRRDILSTPYRAAYHPQDRYTADYGPRGVVDVRRTQSVFYDSPSRYKPTTTSNGRVVGAIFEPNQQAAAGTIAPPAVSRRLSLGAQPTTQSTLQGRPVNSLRTTSTPYGGVYPSQHILLPPPRFDDRPTHILVEDYVQETLRGNHIKVFELFYDEHVTMSDNGISERVGKRECREYKQRFLESVVTWHDIRVRSVIVDGNTAVLEFMFDITFRSGRRMIQKQALVQRWRHGRIEHEISYHTV